MIGKRSGDKSSPGEGELLEGRKADTSDDWEERKVNDRMVDFLEENGAGGCGEHWLSSFHNLAERDGTGSEGEDREGVSKRSPETNRGESLPVVTGQLRGLAETSQPHRDDEDYASQELQGGQSPVSIGVAVGILAESIARLLVVDIVKHVTDIPYGKVGNEFNFLCENLLE